MSNHKAHQPHGSGVRGINSLPAINGHEGRFGRLFPDLKPAHFDNDDLIALATAMKGGHDPAKDGEDDEESHIPAAYTYLGQFIDHDITFDPSTFQQQKSDPAAIIDFRTPRFDLDNVYGRGPSDQPYLYAGPVELALGASMTGASRNPHALDLPRASTLNGKVHRAVIGDPRNDENTIVSQFHGLMLKFHNAVAAANPTESFETVQRQVRWHYQWMVLRDFLPKIVEAGVLDSVSPGIQQPALGVGESDLRIYNFDNAVMPVEFSVAAYRLGHSMVRPGYRLNEDDATLLPIFDQNDPTKGLNAFGEYPAGRAIDWLRFIDRGPGDPPETIKDRVQLAYKIDTSLVEPLSFLPPSVAGTDATAANHLISLAYRNLLRGWRLRLPSGQSVATAIGVTPLHDQEIFIGSAQNGTTENIDPDGHAVPTIQSIGRSLVHNCPLWVYILAESRRNFYHSPLKQAQLGPVGGRIVAETFVALLLKDETSILTEGAGWVPTLGAVAGQFTLKDLVTLTTT